MRCYDEGKKFPSLWAVTDGQSIEGSGYCPNYIYDEKRLILLFLDQSQILMI